MQLESDESFPLDQAVRSRRAVRILLADDDDDMRRLIAARLRRDDYLVSECADGACVLEKLKSCEESRSPPPDVVVCDICMPGPSGLDVLELLRARHSTTPVILISAYDDEQTRFGAEQLGAAAIFHKPFDIDDLSAELLRWSPAR